MTYLANYRKAVKTAIEVLEDYDIPQAPIDLWMIINALSREIAVKPYSDIMIATGKSLEEVIVAFNSNMGVCCYVPTTSKYLIYYNDALSDPWTRFTLAHELGHIFLEHHRLAGTDILDRQLLSNEEYDEYEKEANVFARNLLSPAPLAWNVIDEGRSHNQNHDIQNAFDVSETAANVRVNMIRRDLLDYSDTMKSAVRKIHIKYHKYCGRCKSYLPTEAKYCIICGNSRLSKNLWYKPLPPIIKTDKEGYFEQCPQCGNADVSDNSSFCMICGSPLKNLCLGNSRDGKNHKRHPNHSCSYFCAECGSQTVFNYRQIKIKEEADEVKYTDGVDYDASTLRVKKCPVCGNDEFSEKAVFCRICGTNLYNMCEGIPEEDSYNGLYYREQHPNPSNARYCETCGKKTHYFMRNILKDYETYQREEAEAQANGFMNIPDITDFNISIPNDDQDDEPPFIPDEYSIPFN